MKILITAATTAYSHKIKRLLDKGQSFVLADYTSLPPFMVKENQLIQIPQPGSASFAHELLTLCLDHQIDYVYPLRRMEVAALAEAQQLFEEYGIRVVAPDISELGKISFAKPSERNICALYKGQILFTQQDVEPGQTNASSGIFIESVESKGAYNLYIVD